jgi:hypothetical protein
VIAIRHLHYRWWDADRHADRMYWCVMTSALGVLELYLEHEREWVLDVVQD